VQTVDKYPGIIPEDHKTYLPDGATEKFTTFPQSGQCGALLRSRALNRLITVRRVASLKRITKDDCAITFERY
jgi:hypothetical protein